MDNRNILIDALQERLNYITFIEEECNPDEIAGIVSLLNILDPVDIEIDAEASYERFKGKYKDRLPKYFNKKKHSRIKIVCTLCISAAALFVVVLQLRSSASPMDGFFKNIKDQNNGVSFIISGNEEEEYSSFDDLPEGALDGLLVPNYIPRVFELDKITQYDGSISMFYSASSDGVSLNIKIYPGTLERNSDAEIVGDREVNFSQTSDYIKAEFYHNKHVYNISGTISLSEIKKVISGLN